MDRTVCYVEERPTFRHEAVTNMKVGPQDNLQRLERLVCSVGGGVSSESIPLESIVYWLTKR